jgi:serine protease DegQ
MHSVLLSLSATAALVLPASAQTSVADVVRVGSPSVLTVRVFFNTGSTPTMVQRSASCVILDSTGLALTNEHLITELRGPNKGDYWLNVLDNIGRRYKAEIVAVDERLDLALIKIDTDRRFPALALADSSSRTPGERTVAIGAPNPRDHYNYSGSLALPSGPIKLRDAVLGTDEVLMTDSRFHETLDGGPLLDAEGRMLGLHNSSHITTQFLRIGEEDDPPPSTDYDVIVSSNAIRKAFGEHLENAPTQPRIDDAPTAEAAVAISAVAPAVVGVWCGDAELHPAHPDPADPQAQRIGETHGSGVLVGANGLVLTHAALFKKENKTASVRLADGRTFPGTLVARDKKGGALVALEVPEGTKLPVATLADSTNAIAGEFAAIIGRPFSGQVTMSVGVMSSLERKGLVQVASWVHPGHWGGALVDRTGKVLGVAVEQPKSTDRANEDSYLGFAVPTAELLIAFEDKWAELGGAPEVIPYTDEETAQRRTSVAEVTELTKGSLINVLVKKALPQADTGFDPFASTEKAFLLLGQGSGVIIHSSGLAISNWHVVDAAMESDGSQSDEFLIEVTMPDGRSFTADVLSTSRDDDLALLSLRLEPGVELVPIVLGDSDAIEVGAPVIAIGNPLGLANSVSAGVISAKDHDTMIQGRLREYEGMLMTDAAINPGNSGGALLDTKGRLVGINSAGTVGIGMAIPVERARSVFSDKLLSTEKTRSVYLGMEVFEDPNGLVVDRIDKGGPAERAKLEVGDRILQYAGAEVKTAVVFARMRMQTAPGAPLSLRVQREDAEVDIEVTPLRFETWHAFRQCGIEVEEVDYRTESQLVQDAGIALHRTYTGDDTGQPATLMSGALRVTRAQPIDEDHALDVQVGDLLLGITVITMTTADIYEKLERFESVDHMKRQFDAFATKDGQEGVCWILRDGEIISTQVWFKRPPRKT